MSTLTVVPGKCEAREALRKFAEELTGYHINSSMIKSIHVSSFSSRIKRAVSAEIKVGEELNLDLADIPHAPVLAIFEAEDYLVITSDKLKTNKRVYLFSSSDVLSVDKEL